MSSIYRITLPRNERHGFNKARLNISVGQDYHEGEKFLAQTEWVARHFNECVINICDTLQRHNLEASGIHPIQAQKMALINGKGWLERNNNAIRLLPKPTIIHWDKWLSHPEWEQATQTIEGAYHHNPTFKKIADETAESFLKRREFHSNKELKIAHDYSLRYILEEAAFAQISSYQDVADIYPGTFPPIFDYMREIGMTAPVSMTSIGFKRRTQKPKAA